VADRYDHLIAGGALISDPKQKACARALDELCARLAQPETRSWFSRPGGQKRGPRGLYIWGGVGRGKTLLMDMFFESSGLPARRRLHFFEFMEEVHLAIGAFRRAENGKSAGARDPVAAVAAPIAARCKLLCLDEFMVTDITDAMLLMRLFEALFARGLVLVATSNLPPERLYENGLNRQLFAPFVPLLAANAETFELDASQDYRRTLLSRHPVYFFAEPARARADMDEVWADLTGGEKVAPITLEVPGRQIVVPAAARGTARFSFAELCEAPLGAADYLRIAHRFHTLMIDAIPHLDRARADAAKRLITLIDTLYDNGTKLVASFGAPLEELGVNERTSFEFQRTLSRLIEMQSEAYISATNATRHALRQAGVDAR
jgi:cell division protein ZapE